MKKVIRNGKSIVVILDDGTILQNDSCTDEMYNALQACTNDEDRAILMLPGLQKTLQKRKEVHEFFNRVAESSILAQIGSSVYWKEISELSMPQNFVEKILDAESSQDWEALEAYKNFWTLLCLNPDERVRQNLFWYLNNWGMRISKAGLFVGYRNVDIAEEGNENYFKQNLCAFIVQKHDNLRAAKKSTGDCWVVKNPQAYGEDDEWILLTSTQVLLREAKGETFVKYNLREAYNQLKAVGFKPELVGDDTVFTDHYTHTLQIKIGKMVTIPREECDCDSDIECSAGLHLGGTSWLERNYFGSVGLACLCNPRDVVAVPYDAQYGKLRTCAYLPVARVEYGEDGHVIPLNVTDGFDSMWVKTILYDGIKSTENSPVYHIDIPDIPELNKPMVTQQVLEIARKYMK